MEMVGGCCVCLDERGWDENPLVYCDGHGCNVAVHQACYGIVKVPKGPWFCCKCQSTERVARVKCELCPFKEGALKRTDNGGWAHVVCALYIPEVRFGNVTTMEPILITSIPNERFLKTCYICEENGRESKTSNGACTSCNKPGCKLNFHVTCAQSKRMLCEEAGHCGNVQYVGYCSQHWSKKNKGHTTGNSDPKKSAKEKEKVQRSRQDSVSSSDGSSNKQKNKKQNNSAKSALNSSDSIQDIAAHVHALPSKVNNFIDMKTEPQKLTAVHKAGNAEQSAAESLNLLQQLPSIMDYFPPDARPKTPLNTVIPPLNSPTQFSLPGVFNQPQNSSNSIEVTEDLIDVESTKTPPLNLNVDSQKMPSQKANDKQKSGPSTIAKTSTPLAKSFLPPKKPSASHPKSNMANSKNLESKKRKTADAEKASKKLKIEDKKKLQAKKREKHNDLSIPRPSKLNLYDDDRIPPLLSSKKRDQSSETLKDLMESQWDQGAQLLFQKATHFNVGSLMSCLHQLKAENEDLESRLGELSARRDRLVAATSRLSKPFDASAELNRQLPLSSMLSKLNSSPTESKRGCKEKRPSKSKLKATESEDSASIKTSRSKKIKTSNGFGKSEKCDSPDIPECYSDSSLDGLGCKEVLSEDNSLNSSPKTAKPTKKEQKRKEGSSYPDEARTTNHQHLPNNLHSLVQPPISLHSDPSLLAGGDSCYSKNPSEFIQQMMMKQQINMNRLIHQGEPVQQGSPNVMDYFPAQMTNGNTRKEVKSNGQVDRSPTAHVSGPYRPVITSNSRGKSPKENGK